VGTVAFAFSRLGETSLLERDGISLKTGAYRLSDTLRKSQGELLVLSPERDSLAWAKISGSSTVHACNNQVFTTKQSFSISQAITTLNKPHYHETRSKPSKNRRTNKTLASLTWKMLAKRL